MFKVMLFLHVLGAVGMGFYIVLPIMIGRASKLAGVGQGGLGGRFAFGESHRSVFSGFAAADRRLFDVAG